MSNKRLKNWQELPIGGIIKDAGNAKDYETGTWRTWKPIWIEENCIHCLQCWVFCPDEAFILRKKKKQNGKPKQEIKEINYFHCKGCGLCAKECPINKKGKKKAIDFIHDTIQGS